MPVTIHMPVHLTRLYSLAYGVMAYIVMAYIAMAYIVKAYIVMAYIFAACIFMAHAVIAYILTADIAMASVCVCVFARARVHQSMAVTIHMPAHSDRTAATNGEQYSELADSIRALPSRPGQCQNQ